MITIKPFQTLLTLVLFFMIPAHSFAGGYYTSESVQVEIIGDRRGLLHRFDAGSERVDTERSYIIARQDERYRIRISNRGNRRVGVIIAVDGRNIISGKKSHLQPNERMYILSPYQSQEYDGWRTGRNQINRFYFTTVDDSYSDHWGDRTAMGVVAVAVFDERRQNIYKEKGRQPAANGNSRKDGRFNMQRQPPGTGFGEGEWSPSREVRFTASHRPAQRFFIKYEWRKTLCRKGIIQCRPKNSHPGRNRNRFWPDDRPRHRHDDGFAPFPLWFLPSQWWSE